MEASNGVLCGGAYQVGLALWIMCSKRLTGCVSLRIAIIYCRAWNGSLTLSLCWIMSGRVVFKVTYLRPLLLIHRTYSSYTLRPLPCLTREEEKGALSLLTIIIAVKLLKDMYEKALVKVRLWGCVGGFLFSICPFEVLACQFLVLQPRSLLWHSTFGWSWNKDVILDSNFQASTS